MLRHPSAAILLFLLAGCGSKPADPPAKAVTRDGDDPLVAELAADPERLAELRRRCRADRTAVGAATCETVAQANRRRFFGPPPAEPGN
ncbi:entry exclusion lipoprotein TrbK [Sphingomonas sp. BT-65]|uniref:entry exclusion lipoprotein TrbK n=1 Tax=Sphingomonas sp. BT-65 TaxID=2989821 RepID=UPI0022362410|nr:entry exclusion lipoprotein TrbK [Sphingomonas sp. BT-65]MCW4460815.1 entry exclusion lipoprotein TrbK [Sphingomonas sp. BT-65]